jgi:Tfp pilus assembly protein PilO
MGKVLAPFLFLTIAAGLFFSYIDPGYEALQALRAQEVRLDDALRSSKDLQEKRESLLARYAAFSDQSLARLLKLLPDNVDNVRLVIDIDSIAATYGLEARDYAFAASGGSANATADTVADMLGNARLTFTVRGRYEDFKSFLFDLESSLRVLDAKSVTVATAPPLTTEEGEQVRQDELSYTVSLTTYWLQ